MSGCDLKYRIVFRGQNNTSAIVSAYYSYWFSCCHGFTSGLITLTSFISKDARFFIKLAILNV